MRLLVPTTCWPRNSEDPLGSFVRELAEALGPHGIRSCVVAMDAPAGGALQAFEDRRWGSLARATLGLAGRTLLRRLLDPGPFDMVLSHWLVPCSVLGAVLGLPHVGVAHGGDLRILESRPRLRRWIVGRLDGVVAVSRCGAAGLRARRCLVAPMGVEIADLGPPSPPPPGPLRLLFLGRQVPLKGLDVLLRAVEGLRDVELTVAGGPAPSPDRLPPNARCLGPVPMSARRGLLTAHHVVCVPSVGAEGCPRVVAEAYAAGRPVLASRIGGLPERVPADWLLPPGDVPTWRGRIESLAAEPRTAKAPMSPNEVSWERPAASVARFLRSILARSWRRQSSCDTIP